MTPSPPRLLIGVLSRVQFPLYKTNSHNIDSYNTQKVSYNKLYLQLNIMLLRL